MVGFLVFLLIAWLVLSVLGFVIKGLLWLALLGIVLFVVTAIFLRVERKAPGPAWSLRLGSRRAGPPSAAGSVSRRRGRCARRRCSASGVPGSSAGRQRSPARHRRCSGRSRWPAP